MTISEYRKLFIYATIWWLIVVVLMGLMTIASMFGQKEATSPFLLVYEFACLIPWIISTPFIFYLLKQFPLNDDLKIQSIIINIGFAFFVFVFHTLVQVGLNDIYWGDSYEFGWSRLRLDFISFFQLRVLYYLVLVIGFYMYQLSSKRSQYLIEEARLKSDINKAKFEQLHVNIHPFLLINTIDAAIEKCNSEPLKAEPILHRLSELIRMQLKKLNQEMLTIEQNLILLTKYLELIGFRSTQAIPLEIRVPSNLMDYRIPSLNYILLILEDLIYHKNTLLNTLKSVTVQTVRKESELHFSISLDGGKVEESVLHKLMYSEQQKLIFQSMSNQLDGEFEFKFNLVDDSLMILIIIKNADYVTTKYNQAETAADIKYLTS